MMYLLKMLSSQSFLSFESSNNSPRLRRRLGGYALRVSSQHAVTVQMFNEQKYVTSRMLDIVEPDSFDR